MTTESAAALGARLTQPIVLVLAAIVALLVLGELVSPGFASPTQIVRMLVIASLLGIVSAGQNLVILGGREGIDLSVGALIGIGALIAGNTMNADNAAILPAFGLTVLVCTAFGLLNGMGVTLLRIPPLVMTLGMAGVVMGLLIILTKGLPSGRAAPALVAIVKEPLAFGVPGILFIWAALGAFMVFFLKRTPFGLRIYAIGSNQDAAALAGIAVRRTRAFLFALSGFFSGLTGFLLIGYTESVYIGVGDQYMLPSIIAVVFGGTSLAGGTGGYIGTMAGAVLLIVLQSVLTTFNIEPFGRQIIFGATLLGLMLFYGRQRRLRN